MVIQKTLSIRTDGRGTRDITADVNNIVADAKIHSGICHVFVHHTSASVILCENADPVVRDDLETYMSRNVPDGDPDFRHSAEGPDDMVAHIRSILTGSGLSIPVQGGRCLLGTWQGIYLWEHRTSGHSRKFTVTLYGE
jgi:secondary thiamine-phosphate synthase enzyme